MMCRQIPSQPAHFHPSASSCLRQPHLLQPYQKDECRYGLPTKHTMACLISSISFPLSAAPGSLAQGCCTHTRNIYSRMTNIPSDPWPARKVPCPLLQLLLAALHLELLLSSRVHGHRDNGHPQAPHALHKLFPGLHILCCTRLQPLQPELMPSHQIRDCIDNMYTGCFTVCTILSIIASLSAVPSSSVLTARAAVFTSDKITEMICIKFIPWPV